MKTKAKPSSPDSDIRGSWPALIRAGKKARAQSIAAKAPFIVVRNGRIIDLNKTTQRRNKGR